MPFANTPVTPQGVVGRQLAANARMVDGTQSLGPRTGRYGEGYALSLVPDFNALCDEGSYFVANNAQTGIVLSLTDTAFSSVNPYITIFNTDPVGGKRIYMDAVTLIDAVAGASSTSLQMAASVGQGNLYTSGGSALTPVNPNMDDGTKSIATVNCGNLVAVAGSRTLVGNRYLKGALPVIGDEYCMKFGGVDATAYFQISTILKAGVKLPPIVIGPQQTFLLYIWLPGQLTTPAQFFPEVAWFER